MINEQTDQESDDLFGSDVYMDVGLLPGTIILGITWGVWHLPLFSMPATWHAQIGFAILGFWTFILLDVGLSLLMTWVYLKTGRSILSGMLMHFTANFTSQLIAPSSERFEVIRMILLLVIGLVVCLLMACQKQNAPLMAEPVTARQIL